MVNRNHLRPLIQVQHRTTRDRSLDVGSAAKRQFGYSRVVTVRECGQCYDDDSTTLNVRFTLGWVIRFERGTSCSHNCCVEPRMIKTSPDCKTMSVGVCDRSLRRIRNFRATPKLTEAITGLMPSTFSSSACQSVSYTHLTLPTNREV